MEAVHGFALALIEGVADASMKRAAQGGGAWATFMAIGFAGYNALAMALYYFLKKGLLWKVNSYWDLTSHFVDLIIAFVLFKEKASPRELAGLALAIVGVLIIETAEKTHDSR
jgi:drug/metabolite transporter (DMT)-like permease